MNRQNRRIARRVVFITVTLVSLILIASVALAALSYPFMTITKDKVNLRRAASSTSTILDRLELGTDIEVLGASGSYYKVKVNGRTGYILKTYVVDDPETVVKPTEVPLEIVSGYPYTTVTTAKVNLRAARSTNAKILKSIPKGAEITVRAVSGTYATAVYNGTEGYVKTDFITLKKVVKPTATPTAVPTLSPAEDAGGYKILQQGSTGKEVKALQEALIELGFLSGNADGNFGVGTEYAVISFQSKNDYPATGIMDANIQAFLYSGKPRNSKGTAAAIKTLAPIDGVTMKLHNTGDAVGELQKKLSALGYYTGSISCKYDIATRAAVTNFQKKNGLTADGIAGAATQKLIFSDESLGAKETPTPTPEPTATPVPTFTQPLTTVRRNSTGADAKMVQQRLKELKYYSGAVDGKFGTFSVAALKKFQAANGLKDDGIAGKTTYNVLFSLNALAKGTTPTPLPTAEPTPTPVITEVPVPTVNTTYATLKEGDTGEDVRTLQQRLIYLGYLYGEEDGKFGSDTTKAVKAFQKVNGLNQDGKAGNQTLQLLYSNNAKKAEPTATPTAAPTATPTAAPTAGPTATLNPSILRKGDAGEAVKAMQQKLIDLGYLTGKADGKFGVMTFQAVVAFQKKSKLSVDGIAGAKTLAALNNTSGAVTTATPAPTAGNGTGTVVTPSASKVQYANWYTTVKAVAKKYPYATVYDYATGISWQVHIFSLGAHGDAEPVTANDTAKMERAFGGNTWNPKAVWVVFADGSVYMASTHSVPHEVQHIKDNNFDGHTCIHFPRTQAQVTAIGPYATSHQQCIDAGWAKTQAMAH